MPDRSHRPLRIVFTLLGLFCSAASLHAAPPDDMEALIEEYHVDSASISRFYDIPWSPETFDRIERLQKEWKERLSSVDFVPLGQPDRVDYLLLRTRLNAELDHVAFQRGQLAEMVDLLPFRQEILDLEKARWKREPLDAQRAAAQLADLPDRVKHLREQIERGKKELDAAAKKTKEAHETKAEVKPDADGKDGSKDNASSSKPEDHEKTAGEPGKEKNEPRPLKVTPVVANRAAQAADSLREALEAWFSFYDGFTPEFAWWVRKPHEAASKALQEYAKFLREEIAGLKGKDEDPLVGDPVQEAHLKRLLAAEMIAYSPQEILAIGERELAWCEGEMKKAAREMGLGDDWKAALGKVKASFAPPGGQDAFVSAQAEEAIRFVNEHQLVTIPPLCLETWRLSMTSPQVQKTMPYAAYGGQSMMVSYANESMSHEDKLMSMRGNNRYFTRIVTAHELIPGHHLERYQSDRYRNYRRLFSTPFFVEGWGLYWEMRLWDLGYAKSPEDRVGMLFWRMNRAARIVVSMSFHLGKMTPAQMVDFMVDRVGNERLGATSEVRRYLIYSPLYQIAYMIGGKQLYALHKEAVESGKMTEKEFHDAILHGHARPVEMVRAEILGLPLTPDFTPQWRFADPVPIPK